MNHLRTFEKLEKRYIVTHKLVKKLIGLWEEKLNIRYTEVQGNQMLVGMNGINNRTYKNYTEFFDALTQVGLDWFVSDSSHITIFLNRIDKEEFDLYMQSRKYNL